MLHNESSRVKIPALESFICVGYEFLSLKNYTVKGFVDEDNNIYIFLLWMSKQVLMQPHYKNWQMRLRHHRSPYDNMYRTRLHDGRYYRDCAGVKRRCTMS